MSLEKNCPDYSKKIDQISDENEYGNRKPARSHYSPREPIQNGESYMSTDLSMVPSNRLTKKS